VTQSSIPIVELEYRGADRGWRGYLHLPEFCARSNIEVFRESYPGKRTLERFRKGLIRVILQDPGGKGPSPEQHAAVRYLTDHELEVWESIAPLLFERFELEDRLMAWTEDEWLESPAEVGRMTACTCLEASTHHWKGYAYLAVSFNAVWAAEGDESVLVHPHLPAQFGEYDALELIVARDDYGTSAVRTEDVEAVVAPLRRINATLRTITNQRGAQAVEAALMRDAQIRKGEVERVFRRYRKTRDPQLRAIFECRAELGELAAMVEQTERIRTEVPSAMPLVLAVWEAMVAIPLKP
jgi:hypothetical protein